MKTCGVRLTVAICAFSFGVSLTNVWETRFPTLPPQTPVTNLSQVEGVPKPALGRLIHFAGKVIIIRSRTGYSEPPRLEMPLEHGDAIKTGEDSSAAIQFNDGSILRIKSNSTVIIRWPRSVSSRQQAKMDELDLVGSSD